MANWRLTPPHNGSETPRQHTVAKLSFARKLFIWSSTIPTVPPYLLWRNNKTRAIQGFIHIMNKSFQARPSGWTHERITEPFSGFPFRLYKFGDRFWWKSTRTAGYFLIDFAKYLSERNTFRKREVPNSETHIVCPTFPLDSYSFLHKQNGRHSYISALV